MPLADTHCHLDRIEIAAIAAARRVGVKYILCPSVTLEGFPEVLKITAHDEDLFAAVGVHPTEEDARQPTIEEIVTLGQNPKVVGVGETGLDFYYEVDSARRQQQAALFKLHIQAAKELKKPLIIHARDAEEEIIKILISENAATVGGVMHCFTGSLAFLTSANL